MMNSNRFSKPICLGIEGRIVNICTNLPQNESAKKGSLVYEMQKNFVVSDIIKCKNVNLVNDDRNRAYTKICITERYLVSLNYIFF